MAKRIPILRCRKMGSRRSAGIVYTSTQSHAREASPWVVRIRTGLRFGRGGRCPM